MAGGGREDGSGVVLQHHELPPARTNNVTVSVTVAVPPHCSDANISGNGSLLSVTLPLLEMGGRTCRKRGKEKKVHSCSLPSKFSVLSLFLFYLMERKKKKITQ